jgi:hypothetical protein
MRLLVTVSLAAVLSSAATPTGSRGAERVEVARVPNGGIQPEVAVDGDGIPWLHSPRAPGVSCR